MPVKVSAATGILSSGDMISTFRRTIWLYRIFYEFRKLFSKVDKTGSIPFIETRELLP